MAIGIFTALAENIINRSEQKRAEREMRRYEEEQLFKSMLGIDDISIARRERERKEEDRRRREERRESQYGAFRVRDNRGCTSIIKARNFDDYREMSSCPKCMPVNDIFANISEEGYGCIAIKHGYTYKNIKPSSARELLGLIDMGGKFTYNI